MYRLDHPFAKHSSRGISDRYDGRLETKDVGQTPQRLTGQLEIFILQTSTPQTSPSFFATRKRPAREGGQLQHE